MTSLSFIECCQLLTVDPKTLRQWLAQAQRSLHAHPTDARIKCLTNEQVFVLANLHDRVLQTSALASIARSTTASEPETPLPLPASSDADVQTRLAQLEAQVATLQTRLTDLAFQLLREREQRLHMLEAQLGSIRDEALVPLAESPTPQLLPGLAKPC